jgi:hypothetical protein
MAQSKKAKPSADHQPGKTKHEWNNSTMTRFNTI